MLRQELGKPARTRVRVKVESVAGQAVERDRRAREQRARVGQPVRVQGGQRVRVGLRERAERRVQEQRVRMQGEERVMAGRAARPDAAATRAQAWPEPRDEAETLELAEAEGRAPTTHAPRPPRLA